MSLEIEEEKQAQNKNIEMQSSNSVKSVTQSDIDELKNGLRKIDDDFESKYMTLDPEEMYKGMDYVDSNIPGEKEMELVARSELEDFQKSNINEINREHDIDVEQLNLQSEKINQDLEDAKYEYQQDLQNNLASNQAQNIANGVQSSSIAQNGQQAIRDHIDYELQKSLNEANRKMAEISLKRSIVENEFQTALDKFDIAYASELEQKVEELNEKYLKTQSLAEEYNQRISEQRDKVLKNWQKIVDKNNSKVSAEKMHEKMYYLLDKMQNLTKSEAMEILNDPEISGQLGSWYKTVLDYATRKVYKLGSEN